MKYLFVAVMFLSCKKEAINKPVNPYSVEVINGYDRGGVQFTVVEGSQCLLMNHTDNPKITSMSNWK